MEAYSLSIVGLLVLCLIPLVLAGMVGPAKGKEKLVGGPVADARDDNYTFRLDRAHGNSVESIPYFAIPAVLAIMVGLGPTYLAILVWAYVLVRVAYGLVYLRGGAGAKGGSLRTMVYILGTLLSFVLIISVLLKAI